MSSRITYPYATDVDTKSLKNTAFAQQRTATVLPSLPNITHPHNPELQQQRNGLNSKMRRTINSPATIHSLADINSDHKILMRQSRPGNSDKPSWPLSEELLQFRNELRSAVSFNEQAILEEKQARFKTDSTLINANNVITQLTARLNATEDRLNEEKSALSSLVAQMKDVKDAIFTSQCDLQNKKELHGNQLTDIRSYVVENQRAKENLEKQIHVVSDDLRSIKNKLDSQQSEFNTIASELRLCSRQLEEENKLHVDALRKQGDIQLHTDQNTLHLRGQVESRLLEVSDVILDVRARQDAEVNERRALEQFLHQKLNEVNMAMTDEKRKRQDTAHTMEIMNRDWEHAAETEKLRTQTKLTEGIEEINKRLLGKEISLREEIRCTTQSIEKMYCELTEKHIEHEKKMREDIESRLAALKKAEDEDIRALTESVKVERVRSKESVRKLDESVSLLEKQLLEQKRQGDKVMAAEIKSRMDHEQHTIEGMDHFQEKMQVAISTLHQAVGTAISQFSSNIEKMKHEIKSTVGNYRQETMHVVDDLQVRMQSLKQKVASLEERVGIHISEETASLAATMKEKMESITMWQDVTSQSISELNHNHQQIQDEMFSIEDKQKALNSEVESRVTTEAESRIRDVENLKLELANLSHGKQPSNFVSCEELQEVKSTLQKLAESVQTVKTVLGVKIQSEEKSRSEDTKRLEEDIKQLNQRIKSLL